jgi:hypothetical protein
MLQKRCKMRLWLLNTVKVTIIIWLFSYPMLYLNYSTKAYFKTRKVMKKMILCVSAYLMAVCSVCSFKFVKAEKAATGTIKVNNAEYISEVYNSIDFGTAAKLPFEVFEKAYKGYTNLRAAGKLNTVDKDVLTVCDMSQSSKQYRMWVIDMRNKKVLMNDYVAHGQGSGDEFATAFSNKMNSHQSSLGFYVTGETYIGQHGLSLRLHGMDNGFNSAAYERDVVVHGARYVSDDFVAGQGKLGRSWGCPAVSEKLAPKLINTIKNGSCLFIYYPQPKYLQTAYWLNKATDYTNQFTEAMFAGKVKKDTNVVVHYSPAMKQLAAKASNIQLPIL